MQEAHGYEFRCVQEESKENEASGRWCIDVRDDLLQLSGVS